METPNKPDTQAAAPANTDATAELDSREGILAALEANPGTLVPENLPSEDEPDPTVESLVEAAEGKESGDAKKDAEAQPEKRAEQPNAPESDPKAEWERIEAEKARLAKEREEIEAARTKPGEYSPEDYESVAKQFEADGNDELAAKARAEAVRVRQQAHVNKLTQAHQASLSEMVKKYPELRDPQSALHRRVDATLKSRPALFSYPEGISDAIEACVHAERSTQLEAAQKRIAELEVQLSAREKLLHPTSGTPTAAIAGQDFAKLPPSKQREALLRAMRSSHERGELVI